MRNFLLQLWALLIGGLVGFGHGLLITSLVYGALTWNDTTSSSIGLGVAAVGSIVAIFEGVVLAILAVVQVNGDLAWRRRRRLFSGAGI